MKLYLGWFTITGHHCPRLLKEYVVRSNKASGFLKTGRKAVFCPIC